MIDEVMEEKRIQYARQKCAADDMLQKHLKYLRETSYSSDGIAYDGEYRRLYNILIELERQLKAIDEAREDLRTHRFF